MLLESLVACTGGEGLEAGRAASQCSQVIPCVSHISDFESRRDLAADSSQIWDYHRSVVPEPTGVWLSTPGDWFVASTLIMHV